jgi:hypothetical protein
MLESGVPDCFGSIETTILLVDMRLQLLLRPRRLAADDGICSSIGTGYARAQE